MTNWKAELEVSEAEMMLRQRHWICVREWADSRANDFVKGETVPTERTMLAMSRMEEELTALLRAVAASGSPPSPELREAFQLIAKWAKSDAPPEIRDDGGVVVPARELAQLADILASSGSTGAPALDQPTLDWRQASKDSTVRYLYIKLVKQIPFESIADLERLCDAICSAEAAGSTGAPNDQPTPETTK